MAELARRRRAGALEQQRRLVHPPLTAPQLREGDQRAGHHRGARAQEVGDRALERGLRVGPAAAAEVDGAVLRPAEREHVAAPVALGERGDPVAPLERPVVVAHGHAGAHQEAAGPRAGDRDGGLLGERRRRGLVEAAHALAHVTAGHQRGALEGEAEHHEVGHPEAHAQLRRRSRELGRPLGLPARARHVALEERQPAVVAHRLAPVEQPVRACEPARRRRRSATEVQVVARQPRGHARRGGRIPALGIEPVRALARGEHRLGVVEPPGRPAQALETLGTLGLRHGAGEEVPRGLPSPLAERGPAEADGIGGHLRHGDIVACVSERAAWRPRRRARPAPWRAWRARRARPAAPPTSRA